MKHLSFIFFFILVNIPFLGSKESRKTVCLNMIVKDENSIIETCLASVKNVIDYWVIVDTGSTDGTQETIKKFLKDVPGELHERKWVNFAHNRNEALDLARGKADYLLFVDADEQLKFEKEPKFPPLTLDAYDFVVNQIGTECDYLRIGLINSKLNWKWHFVIHESIICHQPHSRAILKGVVNLSDTTKGARSNDPEKYLKDAAILEKALEKEPNHSRYQFYLGQAYSNAGKHEKALENFKKRAKLGDCPFEIYWSKVMIGQLQEILKKPSDEIIESYKQAFAFRPTRAEAPYFLGRYLNSINQHAQGYEFLKKASELPLSQDPVFVQRWIYQWGALFELAKSCHQLDRQAQLLVCMEKMVNTPSTPANIKEEMKKNISIIYEKNKIVPYQKN